MGNDVIGDIHGQHTKLKALLSELGYRVRAGAYRHPAGRVAVFVGDLIDRGPGQVEVVEIVRRMEAAGSARVVMGNHELNAIGYATPTEDGADWLRKHTATNEAQHRAFLDQVGRDSALHRELIAWFRTLPVALDLGGIRVCHAWWDDELIAAAAQASDKNGRLAEGFLRASFRKGEAAHVVLEGVTKGLEVRLPNGYSFVDPSGATRTKVRVRWWDDEATTFRAAALVPEDQRACIPDVPLPSAMPPGNPSAVPVFVGHYWLTGRPGPQNANTAVLDYGAGLKGPLVAYRW
ncbi:MAG: metallophosphoesterase, partial [Anaerolineaceae bacterium]